MSNLKGNRFTLTFTCFNAIFYVYVLFMGGPLYEYMYYLF